ncbi:MAG TPA: hypothetical protein VIU94_00920, partial [Streptomyces sp.]
MRPQVSSRAVAMAICAALTLGTAGPAFADSSPASRAEATTESAESTAARDPLPNAAALLAQVEALADLGGVLTPVTDLLDAVLNADDGQLPAADAKALADKIKAAIAAAKPAAPAPVA